MGGACGTNGEYVVVVQKGEEMRHLGLYGSIILKWVMRNRMGEDGLDSSIAGQG
jgi:hypothetical protein